MRNINGFLDSLGLSVVDTGGGCRAYRGEREGGGHVLVTAIDDPSLPRDGTGVRVGYYDADEVLVGEALVREGDDDSLKAALSSVVTERRCAGCGYSTMLCICQRDDSRG